MTFQGTQNNAQKPVKQGVVQSQLALTQSVYFRVSGRSGNAIYQFLLLGRTRAFMHHLQPTKPPKPSTHGPK